MKPKFTYLFSVVFLICLMVPDQVLTQKINNSSDFTWTGAWQYGTSAAVAVDTSRSYAFLASGGAVLTLDISDPANPTQLNKSIHTAGQVLDIHVDYDEQHILLACDEVGLEIWDVADVNNPSKLSGLEIIYGGVETPVRHVELYNDFAVTENEWGYVHTVDISDPENPFQVAFNGVMGNPAHDISVSSDGYIHATGAQYFVLLEIEADGSLNLAANFEYVAGSVYGTTEASFLSYNGTLFIINRTNGDTSYRPESFSDIVVRNDKAYLAGDSSLIIYDVADISNPTFLGEVSFSSLPAQLDVMGDYAFLACSHDGMRVIDFSDPSNPMLESQFEGTGVTWASKVSGNYAYLANSSTGVSIIDISNPNGDGPEKVAGISSNEETRDVDVEGDELYFADWTAGLRIYDVSDPLNPGQLGSIQNVNAWRVDVNNDDLYMINANANNPDTLEIYDVSDPANPVFQSEMLLPDLIWKIMFYEDHLYIAASDSGLIIVDVSDPANPDRVSSVDVPETSDVDIENDTALVASTDWNGGLITIDIGDPANPQILNTYNPSGWYSPFHVAIEGNYAYAGENFGQLKMFDVSDLTDPIQLGEYVTSGLINHLSTNGSFLYVSDGPDGLQIMRNALMGINAAFTADDQSVCEGGVVNFTDQSSPGVTSWEWTFEGGTPGTSTDQNPSITYNTSGNWDVELIVSDGVQHDTLLEEDYISVSILPVQVETPSGPTETCQSGTYEYTTTAVAGADIYDWMVEPSDAGSISGDDTVGTFVASDTWTGTYDVKVRAVNNCGDGPWSPNLSANLSLSPTQYTLTGGGTYCEGSGGLELVLDGSETGVDYELFRDSVSTGNILAGTGNPLSFGNYTEEGYYTVTGYDASCSRQMAGENYINAQTMPNQPDMPSGDQMVCNNEFSEYTTAAVPDADTYTWMLSPETAGTMDTDTSSVEVSWAEDFTGSAMLSVYALNECGDGPASDALVISVDMAPSPEVSGPDTICAGITAIYMTEENPGSTYSWMVSGGNILGRDTTSQVNIMWIDPGTGQVSVIEETGEACVDTSAMEVFVDECPGLEETQSENIRIYPNPANNILYIEYLLTNKKDVHLSITDILGKESLKQDFDAGEGQNFYKLDISNLQKGVYILKLSGGQENLITRKIVKN